MFTYEYFHNIKKPSWYLFHDLITSVFILLCFFATISYIFSPKYGNARVAYIGALFSFGLV